MNQECRPSLLQYRVQRLRLSQAHAIPPAGSCGTPLNRRKQRIEGRVFGLSRGVDAHARAPAAQERVAHVIAELNSLHVEPAQRWQDRKSVV